MVAQAARWGVRFAILTAFCIAIFYLGRPLYWKLSATVHDIREKNYDPQAVKAGFSELVHEAQRQVGWVHGDQEAKDTQVQDGKFAKDNELASNKAGMVGSRKLASFAESKARDMLWRHTGQKTDPSRTNSFSV